MSGKGGPRVHAGSMGRAEVAGPNVGLACCGGERKIEQKVRSWWYASLKLRLESNFYLI